MFCHIVSIIQFISPPTRINSTAATTKQWWESNTTHFHSSFHLDLFYIDRCKITGWLWKLCGVLVGSWMRRFLGADRASAWWQGQSTTFERQIRQFSVGSNSRKGENLANIIGKKDSKWKAMKSHCMKSQHMLCILGSNQNH